MTNVPAMEAHAFVQRVPLMTNPPALDRVEPADWRGAAGFDGLLRGTAVEPRAGIVYVGATASQLCFAVMSEVHPDGRILDGERVTVRIAPIPGGHDGDALYAITVDPQGQTTKTTGHCGQPPGAPAADPAIQVRSAVRGNCWHCQILVPATAVGRDRIAGGGWKLDVGRFFLRPAAWASLSGNDESSGVLLPFRFGDDSSAAVQVRHEGNLFQGEVRTRMTLFNPGPLPVRLQGRLALRPAKRDDMAEEKDILLQAGEAQSFLLYIEALAANRFEVSSLATDGNGRPLYRHGGLYSRMLPAPWETPAPPRPPLGFHFAYYPSLNRMRLRADVSGMPTNATVDRVIVVIRPKGATQPIRELEMESASFSNGVGETFLDLPPLQGDFEIVVTPRGRNVPAAPLVRSFVRHAFEWEHGNLGKSRTVYPPFTPIVVDGRRARTVLKEYEFGRSGLLDRARTENPENGSTKDILAAPMGYRARSGGAETSAEPASFKIESAEPDRVVARSRFRIGGIDAESLSTLEYDGMLRVDLTLLPSPGRTLDRLDLAIPLRGEVARMVHAVSCRYRDGVEFKTLPPGEGVVWSAADLPPVGWDENFCTYLFLGDPSRGLCWFTENDRGWARDPAQPNLEVIRRDGRVLLSIHLVSRPVELREPSRLTFGLMAAPVKPRLEGWRHRWYTEQFNVLGCDHHWGGPGVCGSFYPPGPGLLYWELLRRANRGEVPQAEIDAVLARCRPCYQRYGAHSAKGFEDLAGRNLVNRRGKKMIFYYNRSAEPLGEEFQTFMDEWCRDPYNDSLRGINRSFEVMVVPTETFIDYSLYWYGKAFDIAGSCGIYMDNIFFAPSANTVMTGAHRREDGSVSRSTGIWALREQAKRTFVFMNERGMEPIHMAHMTSLAILPILSFYTVQYDWEWQRERGDVQRRYAREYLQLVSNGEHAGAWPVVLHEQGTLAADPWTLKTFLGVTIVHEIIVDPYLWDGAPIPPGDSAENRLFATFRAPILELQQRPDCEVFRYWDARPQPVCATDPDLPGIVFVRNGAEAIFAVTSYAEEDRTAEVTFDPAALGMRDGCRILDIETGDAIPADGNRLRFPIRKHDLREFRILPGNG